MPLIASIDGPNRDIYLSADTVGAEINPIDLYKEMRTLRRTTEELRKYNLFLEAKGYDQKAPGKFTERYVICLEGTRIIPFDISHTLTVTGTIITDDGQEGVNCFDRTPLTSTTVVDINYLPPQVEVITVNTSGGGGDVTNVNEIANAVAAKFLFNVDGHVLSEAVGVTVGQASIDEKVLNRVVQGAIPPPPSNGAIAEELARLLGKPKLYDKEFKAIEQRLAKLAKPAPANNDLAEIKQLIRMLMAEEKELDVTPLTNQLTALGLMLDEIPKTQAEQVDYTDRLNDLLSQIKDIRTTVQSEGKETRDAIKAIPQVDLSGLATSSEMDALKSLAKKLQNYDDSDLRDSIEGIINRLDQKQHTAISVIDRKVDLILDNQMDDIN